MTYKKCPNCGKRQFQRLTESVYQCRACGCNAEQLTIPFPTKKRSSTKRSPKPTFTQIIMKELSIPNINPNLPDTAYLLAYPQLRAVVPGCDNLTQALDHSCIDRKPVLAFRYSDGWIMIAQEEVDRAWNELHINRTMAA